MSATIRAATAPETAPESASELGPQSHLGPRPARSASSGIDIETAIATLVDETVATLTADPVFGRIFDGTASRELYLRFLERTYQYVVQTEAQLDGGARALEGETDAAGRALHERFREHASEEVGHDRWVLDDIRALGGDVEAAMRAAPGPAVRAYLAMGAFITQSRRPLGVMGIGALLEGLSVRLASSAARNLKLRSGIPNIENAVSFLASHGEADVDHTDEGNSALRLVTDERDRQAILACAQMTSLLYIHLLDT